MYIVNPVRRALPHWPGLPCPPGNIPPAGNGPLTAGWTARGRHRSIGGAARPWVRGCRPAVPPGRAAWPWVPSCSPA